MQAVPRISVRRTGLLLVVNNDSESFLNFSRFHQSKKTNYIREDAD